MDSIERLRKLGAILSGTTATELASLSGMQRVGTTITGLCVEIEEERAAAVLAERERCAEVAESLSDAVNLTEQDPGCYIAAAIRARK